MEKLRPQKGPQEAFLASPADIVIYGGAAGGGKSFALLMEPLRNMRNPKFNALLLRHEFIQITSPGGLWDTARKVYGGLKGAYPSKTPKHHWTFKSGATVNFAHLTRDEDVESWQGSQIAMIGFDELTHFSEYQFFYMLSRNRSDSGVAPFVRATCNPDCDSWVASFISWWIDQDTGYAIPERSGVIRWFVRIDNKIHWFDTEKEAKAYAEASGVFRKKDLNYSYKSVTFIASTLDDNKILMDIDPGYLANLNGLPYVERERLLKGNWKIRNKAGLMFQRQQVKIVPGEAIARGDILNICRAWDLAATTEDEHGDPAYTAGVLMARLKGDRYAVLNVIVRRLAAGDVLNLIINTAHLDRQKYGYVRNRIPQDPGQAGKAQASYYVKQLSGFDIVARPETGNKEHRATPVAAQWQHGNIDIVDAEWNDEYFSQLESFPDGKFKDMVDATSSAFDELVNYMQFNIQNLI